MVFSNVLLAPKKASQFLAKEKITLYNVELQRFQI